MSKGRELADYTDDVTTAIADMVDFTHGMSYEMFASDKKTVNAVIRCLDVLFSQWNVLELAPKWFEMT